MKSRLFRLISLIMLGTLWGCATSGSYDIGSESINGKTALNGVGQRNISHRHHEDQTISATGYATISAQPSKNPAQQRLMAIRVAKLTAYRSLADQVYGQYLDSTTSTGDFVLGNDFLQSEVRGVIYQAKLERIKPVGDDTYEVTLSLPLSVVSELRQLYLERMSLVRR